MRRHIIFAPCHKLSHFLSPPPPWSVTYFMDSPLGLGRRQTGKHLSNLGTINLIYAQSTIVCLIVNCVFPL